jgi:hypothetical protein
MCRLTNPRLGDPGAIHGVEPGESDIWMDISDRVGHTLVLGTTRVGKTRLAEVLLTQDIRRGEVVIVFDPKGDIDLLRRVYAEAKRAGRHNEFFMFHLGHPEVSARYNPVGSFSRITEVATRIAGQLPSEGQSAAFKEFVWRFVNVMARALVALGRKPDYEQINRYASNVEPLLIDYFEHWLDGEPGAAGWREEVRIDGDRQEEPRQGAAVARVSCGDPGRIRAAQEALRPDRQRAGSTLNYEKSYFDKLVASLLPLMEKAHHRPHGRAAVAGSGRSDRLAAGVRLGFGDQPGRHRLYRARFPVRLRGGRCRGQFDVRGSHQRGGKHLQVRHGEGASGRNAAAAHRDPCRRVQRTDRRRVHPAAQQGRRGGFQVTAYTQTWSDVEARIGSQAKAGQIAGNFNTLIMLRVKEVATAELLTSQLPEVRSGLDHRFVLGLGHQRSGRFCGLRQPQ